MSYLPARTAAKLFKLTLLSLPLLLAACSNSGSTPSVPDSSTMTQMGTTSAVQVDATRGTAAGTNGSYVTLLSNGASAKLTVPSGVSGSQRLQLQAKGDLFQGAPIVEVRRGGTVLSKVTISSATASLYDAGTVTVQPGDVLEIVFVNDASAGGYPNDRNALIDYGLFTPVTATTAPSSGSTSYRLEAEHTLNARALRGTDPSASGEQVALLLTTGAGLSWTVPATASVGTYTLTAQARQQAYRGDAQLAVRVNGVALRTVAITSGSFQNLALGTLSLKPGDTVELIFTNDAYGGSAAADRNAYLDFLTLTPLGATTSPVTTSAPTPTPVTTPPVAAGTPSLFNPNASADTRKLYTWIANLKTRSSNRVLIGQNSINNNGWDIAGTYSHTIEGLYQQTGKYPAMTEAGLIDNHDAVVEKLKAWHAAGGIAVVNAHWPDPWGLSGSAWLPAHHYDSLPTAVRKPDLKTLLSTAPASPQKTKFWNDVTRTFDAVQKLEDANVPVLFRLFHEMNLLHFWWGANASQFPSNSADFVALWKDVQQYATVKRGLNNIIWVYAPSADFDPDNDNTGDYSTLVMSQYPGNAYVDIVGWDIYKSEFTLSRPADYNDLKATGKPLYIHEIGPSGYGTDWDLRTTINVVRNQYPEVFGLMFWHSWDAKRAAIVDNRYATELLNDSWSVTREELDWR